MNNKLEIGIVGAGIQGISNALFLQKKGFNVKIFDRDEPGSPAASYGNAGHFSPYASLSLNRTDVLADVPAMLLSSTGPLALKWNYVPKMLPWFFKFILNINKNKKVVHHHLGPLSDTTGSDPSDGSHPFWAQGKKKVWSTPH